MQQKREILQTFSQIRPIRSGCVGFRQMAEDCTNGVAVRRSAQLFQGVLIAQYAGNASQRLEMICACAFGSQQQKDDIDRLVVHWHQN